MPPDKTFRSRVDAWLVVLVGGAAAVPIIAAIWLGLHGHARGVLLLACWGTTMVVVGAVLSWPLRYTLRADRLHIPERLARVGGALRGVARGGALAQPARRARVVAPARAAGFCRWLHPRLARRPGTVHRGNRRPLPAPRAGWRRSGVAYPSDP